VMIPAGEFWMGSSEGEESRNTNEGPRRKVMIAQSFFMGKYAIDQAQWRAVASLPKISRELQTDPSRFKGDRLPVEFISWYESVEFCERLSAIEPI
jgi:formylglycine-generating enzyme required for sulfatase activity